MTERQVNRRQRPAKPQRQVRLSTYVTEEEAALIEAAVARFDRPVAWFIRRALEPHVANLRADAEAREQAKAQAKAEETAQDPAQRLASEAKAEADARAGEEQARLQSIRRGADRRDAVWQYGKAR